LEVFEPDETNGAILERVLHGIILSDETVCRGASFLSLVDELLLLTLVFFTSLIPLLDEGVFTAPLGYDIRHDGKDEVVCGCGCKAEIELSLNSTQERVSDNRTAALLPRFTAMVHILGVQLFENNFVKVCFNLCFLL
jgi:hypothetical protein